MIVCAEPTLRDFGVIVHEMGHIQYFMAYKDQPTVFQVQLISLIVFDQNTELFLLFFAFRMVTQPFKRVLVTQFSSALWRHII